MRWEFGAEGVAAVRFGLSPLFELGALLRRLRRNVQGGIATDPWRRWHELLARLAQHQDVRLVLELSCCGSLLWIPGSPTMEQAFSDDLDSLRAIPASELRADLSAHLPSLIDTEGIEHVRDRVEGGMVALWDALLDGCWPTVRSSSEHEIARMTAVLRGGGWEDVFDQAALGLNWDGSNLAVPGFESTETHTPTGLIMMPSVFVQSGPVVCRSSSSYPVVVFPARGIGTLFTTAPMSPDPLVWRAINPLDKS